MEIAPSRPDPGFRKRRSHRLPGAVARGPGPKWERLVLRNWPLQRDDIPFMLVQLVGQAFPGLVPFSDGVAAWRMWIALRRAFPQVWAACLVPDQAHILLDVPDAEAARHRFARMLAGCSRRAGLRHCWTRVPRPMAIPFRRYLHRHAREIHLLPCRMGLAADPLSWPWSTHRGLMGAEVDPWVSQALLETELGWPTPSFAASFHEYTSTDPDVSAAGTEPPTSAAQTQVPHVPLERIWRASLSATPWSGSPGRRRLAVLLAHHQGWTSSSLLARALEISPQSVRRLARTEPSWVRAAALCLGDPRLMLDSATALALERATTLDALACAPEGRHPGLRREHVEHAPPAPPSPSRH